MPNPPANRQRPVACPYCGHVRDTKAQPNTNLRCPECRGLYRAPRFAEEVTPGIETVPPPEDPEDPGEPPATGEAEEGPGSDASSPPPGAPRVRRAQPEISPAPPPPAGTEPPAGGDEPAPPPPSSPPPATTEPEEPAPDTPPEPEPKPRGSRRWRGRR